ncbi:MAG: preprotein translocase subunit YajC [Weeksellaceae bacterium]
MKDILLIFSQEPQGGGLSMLLMFGGMFAIMYFLMIRPNRQRQKKEKQYQEDLKRGDWVVTTSGIHGKVFELNADTVVLETGAGKIKFERGAVSAEMSNARYSGAAQKND